MGQFCTLFSKKQWFGKYAKCNSQVLKINDQVFNLCTLFHRQEAFKKAVGNAKAKAQCIAQTVGVQLGSALEVTELSQDVIQGSNSNAGMEVLESEPNRPCPESLHQRYGDATLVYSSEVAITFEVQPLRTCSHKKCRKH